MTPRRPAPRAFLATGTPWKTAVIAYLEPDSPNRPWEIPGEIAPGDAMVSVLETSPPTVMCVEHILDNRPEGLIIDESEDFRSLPTVRLVEDLSGLVFPSGAGRIPTVDPDALIASIRRADSFCAAGRDSHAPLDEQSDVHAARILLGSGSRCVGCSRPLPMTSATAHTHIHIHQAPLPDAWEDHADDPDLPGALCRSCAHKFIHSGYTSLVDYQFSLTPACVQCGAHRTATVAVGMPAGPAPAPPWVVAHGCVVDDDTPEFCCLACGHSWQSVFRDGEPAEDGDRVSARVFNFDGRRGSVSVPEVRMSEQLLIGTLRIDRVRSAWGEYTRHALITDDGAVRMIEPRTIRIIRRRTAS